MKSNTVGSAKALAGAQFPALHSGQQCSGVFYGEQPPLSDIIIA
jgi:hypothetical protein